MKIENGKFYRTRDGQKMGPMNVPPKDKHWSDLVIADCHAMGWCEGGAYYKGEIGDLDLIAEWSDAPAKLMIPLPVTATFRDVDGDLIEVEDSDCGTVWISKLEAGVIASLSPETARDFAAAIIAYADAIDARPKD